MLQLTSTLAKRKKKNLITRYIPARLTGRVIDSIYPLQDLPRTIDIRLEESNFSAAYARLEMVRKVAPSTPRQRLQANYKA